MSASRTPEQDADGPSWPLLLIAFLALGLILWIAPRDKPETPPEPVDPTTRAACRAWHVVLAATGIEGLDSLNPGTRYERLQATEDFMARAQQVALTRNAEQETYLAVVDSIEAARLVRDARGLSEVYETLGAFNTSLDAVNATCEQY